MRYSKNHYKLKNANFTEKHMLTNANNKDWPTSNFKCEALTHG